ncbi:helix-turn-helix transcriptional regulator [Clostridium tetani]|uniref:helix-turn-helix transcriptional regulator n=1 Tax=Clostridium tetani TaxID=1513 RepID=UPI0018F87195|nr:helix-turn-helix domain-containing protein [Clostridium tetani]
MKLKFKIARMKKELTQAQLAKKLGISRSTLVQIEKGNYDNVRIGLAKKIAKALDSTVIELFFNE